MSEVFIIFLLILFYSLLYLVEIAVISSSAIKLQHEAEDGNKKSAFALTLIQSSKKFLSSVRALRALIIISTAVIGGITFSERINQLLLNINLPVFVSQYGAYILIIFSTTYLFLLIGELIPKRIARIYPEKLVKFFSKFIKFLSIIGAPSVWFLNKSSNGILGIFGLKAGNEKQTPVSEEEITAMIEKGTEAGTFEEVEQDIVERLFFLSDRNVGSIMTSKNDIIVLDINEEEASRKKIVENNYINYPVYENDIDNIIGILNSKKYLSGVLSGRPTDIKSQLTPPLFIHDKLDALKLLERFKKTNTEFAIVVDEFGTFAGIVTLKDLFEALVGEITTEQNDQSEIVVRNENSWLIDGLISFDEFLRYFDLHDIQIHKANDFHTLSGFVMYITRHIPKTGEKFIWEDYSFEVIDMDGLRVDKVLVTKLEEDKKEQ